MSPQARRVAVVIPLGKLEGNVLRCVSAALQQTHAPDEVIVVANHRVSAAQAGEMLHPVVGAPALRIVDGSACRNANEARNLGASQAQTEWIALLDSDDWWESDHLESALDLAHHPERPVDFVYGSIRVHADSGVHDLPAEHFSVEHTAENYLLAYRPAQTSTYLVRRALMLAHPWHPELRRHQDYEWFARITKHCRTGVNPAVKVHVEWLEARRHLAHRDCWTVVGAWRKAVLRTNFRRHHRSLIKSALRSRDGFVRELLFQYVVDVLRPRSRFLQP